MIAEYQTKYQKDVKGSTPYLTKIVDLGLEDTVSNKIRSFGNLPDGWDFGVGTHASARTIGHALEIRYYGPSLGFQTNAFPGTDGEISVTFYCEDESVDVTINPDLSYTVVHEKGIGVDYDQVDCAENADFSTILKYLNKLSCARWKSSEDFIPTSTTPTKKGLEVMPSRTPEMEPSPSLRWTVFEIVPLVMSAAT